MSGLFYEEKVYIEYGLLAMAHNLRKVYCHESGVWKDYYIQRAAKNKKRPKKNNILSF